jgi:hypothetical protein
MVQTVSVIFSAEDRARLATLEDIDGVVVEDDASTYADFEALKRLDILIVATPPPA